jgi:hypothetical protein
MAKLDITKAVAGVQSRINLLDSDVPATARTQDMINLFEFSERTGSTMYEYSDVESWKELVDSNGFFDSDNPVQRMAYANYEKKLFLRLDSSSWTRLGPEIEVFGGTISGYAAGGVNLSGVVSNIDEYSFSTDTPSTSIGSLTLGRSRSAGQSSRIAAYTSGGNSEPTGAAPPTTNTDNIEKFDFATNTVSPSVGNLSVARKNLSSSSSIHVGYGYASGGFTTIETSVIDRFPFAADTPATNIGNLSTVDDRTTGNSSLGNGYATGGLGSPVQNVNKYPFSSDTVTATSSQTLGFNTQYGAGASSPTDGFVSGREPSLSISVLVKFPFSSDASGADVGGLVNTLDQQRNLSGGSSSRDKGFVAGGGITPYVSTVQSFSMLTNTDATSINNLTVTTSLSSGHQE